MQPRHRFYIDPDIQFPLILALTAVGAVEGLFVGWAFSKAIAIAQDWARPGQIWEFFKVVLPAVTFLVAVNFALGTWISHKIAGPLAQLRRLMAEIVRGNLEVEAVLREGDLLHAHARDFNLMIHTLRRVLYRDQRFAAESDAILSECQALASRPKSMPAESRDALKKLLDEARSRLSIVNAHFLKGRKEGQS